MLRIWQSLGLAGATLVAAGLMITPGSDDRPASALVTPAGGVLPNSGSETVPIRRRSQVEMATGPVSLRYDFDGGVNQPLADQAGGGTLRALGQNGGELRLVPQRGGFAVAYPQRCTLDSESECPRAILEGHRDDRLNPGTRPLSYGASVLMTSGDLADGANVVQKGYSVGGGSQYKLQVDHLLGHPSCVIAGQRAQIFRAEAWMDVADGQWHDLRCERLGSRLSLTVDGQERASITVPPRLTIANPEPLRVGGKGPADGNDQFAGEIDNVYVSIS